MAHYRFYYTNDMSDREFSRVIARPISDYFQHIEKSYPDKLEEARQTADPKALSLLDDIVKEYNDLPNREKKKKNMHIHYWNRCEAVISGKDQT